MIVSVVLITLASPGGISGYSGMGGATCNTCHTGGTAPTVAIMGPATLMPGASATYSVVISGGAGVRAGFNLAATGGTLIPGAGTRTTVGEVTHSGPGMFSAGRATFSFTFTAPSSASTVMLYGAGLSANGNGAEPGDMAGAATLTVTISGPGGAGAPDGGTSGPPPVVPPTTSGKPVGPGLNGGGVVEGGCSVAGGVPLSLLGLLMLRRRCRRAR